MKNPPGTRHLRLALSALMLTLLAACGGGGGSAEDAAGEKVPLAWPMAESTVCGQLPVAESGPEAYSVRANERVLLNGYEGSVTLLTSPTGYSYAGLEVALNVPMRDLRNVTQTGYPTADPTDSMGVEMGSAFAPGSVGCVAGVSRVFDVNNVHLVSWTSEKLVDVPVERLLGVAVNGFEFTHNFATTEATAVFRMNKSALSDPAAAAICQITFAGEVDCATPDVRDSSDGQQWELRLPMTTPGVYMLTAGLEQLT